MSRNPVVGATSKEKYDEEYVINILPEYAESNAKYGPLFVSQSKWEKHTTEDKQNTSEAKKEKGNDQSQSNRIFQNKNHVITTPTGEF